MRKGFVGAPRRVTTAISSTPFGVVFHSCGTMDAGRVLDAESNGRVIGAIDCVPQSTHRTVEFACKSFVGFDPREVTQDIRARLPEVLADYVTFGHKSLARIAIALCAPKSVSRQRIESVDCHACHGVHIVDPVRSLKHRISFPS